MNWIELKEKYPLSVREIRRRKERLIRENRYYGDTLLLEDFLICKGYKNVNRDYLYALNGYEQKKRNKLEVA